MKVNLSFSEILEKAWQLTKDNKIVIAFAAASMIITCLVSGVVPKSGLEDPTLTPEEQIALLQEHAVTILISAVVQIIVGTIVSYGLYKICFNVYDGMKASINAFSASLGSYAKFFVVELLTGLIVGVGILCCILPGIYLLTRLSMASLVVVDDPSCGCIEAIKRSWNMTKGHELLLLGMLITLVILNIVGLFFCIVGIFVTMTITYFAMVHIYRQLLAELNDTAEMA